MSTLPFFFTVFVLFLMAWSIHAAVALVVAAPVAFLGRKRVHWQRWELLSLVIPFCLWMVVAIVGLSTGVKSLANVGIEPRILGLALGLGALVRVSIGTRVSERRTAIGTLAAICVAALAVALIVPALEE